MPFAVWTPTLATGIAATDLEHQGLFDLVNDLHAAQGASQPKDSTAWVLARLKDYALVHFLHEEALMERIGFPEAEAHRELHRAFIEKALDLEERLGQGVRTIPAETLAFLKDWLITHISEQDMRFVGWMHRHEPKP